MEDERWIGEMRDGRWRMDRGVEKGEEKGWTNTVNKHSLDNLDLQPDPFPLSPTSPDFSTRSRSIPGPRIIPTSTVYPKSGLITPTVA